MYSLENPILRGFNPDPSIVRVGEDYYIATSTFEWFPGVQIHHSKDLKNWRLLCRPLNRLSQLDLRGNPDSCGVWAPCLSYAEGTFSLVYSNVRSFDGIWKDTPNYLVTSNEIDGEWSEPVFLDALGFDGSLFHDEDGRKWYTSMLMDHRGGKFFGGIVLQEYDEKSHRLVGERYHIFEGSELGLTEAPHIYRRNGYYYLMVAEGGTEYGHAVSLLRSQKITGPYILHPQNPILSARDFPAAPLQKTGHADLVETSNGDWYMVFLTGRPLSTQGRCTLGRETAIEQVEWRSDDWLYPSAGRLARLNVPIREGEERRVDVTPVRDHFDNEKLNIHFQSLRIPITTQWLDLQSRPGYLRLYGQESLASFHCQSLIARRVQAFAIEASCCLEFEPIHFSQMAGLICYYNTAHFYYLHLIGSDKGERKYLQLTSCNNFNTQEELPEAIDCTGIKRLQLKVEFVRESIQFFYAPEGESWTKVGPELDGSILSDDYVRASSARYRPAFTGAFVGLCCQDLSGHRKHADFDWFEYREHQI